jgi:DNA-binding Lrp family transcriptional regulator
MDSEVELDEIDIKILGVLIRDVRTKLKDIAENCGLTSNAVFKRIKHLKDIGVIVGTTVYPDARQFGFTHIATIGVNLDYAQEDEVIKLILERAKTNLIELSSSIGKYDLTAFMLAKSLQELDSITQAIRKHPGVKRVAVNIWVSQPCFLLENLNMQTTRV